MIIELVPVHLVAKAWPMVGPLFATVEPHVQGDWTLDQLKADLLTNRLGLLAAVENNELRGVAAVSFQNRRNARTAFISAMAGEGITSELNFAQLKSVLAAQGCTDIEAAVRDSTFRLWRGLGLEEKYRVVGVKL